MSTYRTSRGETPGCNEVREKLPLYVGGDLDPEALAEVRAHLDACADCAARARASQRARQELVSALGSPRIAAGEPSLWAGIRGTLVAEGLIHAGKAREKTVVQEDAGSRARGRLKWLAPLAAAAALIAVVQGSGLLERSGPPLPAPRPPEVAAPESPGTGTLRRIDPLDVEPVVPFQARRPTLGDDGWLARPPVSAVGFRR